MLEYISNKEEIENKVYDVFFNDFLCKIRNLRHCVKFLQKDYTFTVKAIKIENGKEVEE